MALYGGLAQSYSQGVIIFAQTFALVDVYILLQVLRAIGITDEDTHRAEFLDGFLLGSFRHPCVVLDSLGKSILQVSYQLSGTLATAFREIFGNI